MTEAFQAYPVADPAETIAVLQYTGGTTGLPKGAMLTHANLTSTCQQYRATTAGSPPVLAEGQERFLAVLPPFHIYALAVNVLFAILQGAEIIQHVRFDPKAALEDISAKGVSVFCGVPTMFTALINHPETPRHSLRTLKYCGSGGAPLPLEVAQQFAAITGCNLSEGWGMTETSPAGTFTPAQKDGMRKAGSCGMPMPGIVIKFLSIDNPEQYVPRGERGEICIKGPNVMKGYWNNPQATAEATTFDGFLRTGDVGYMDEDGFVFIVDRTKDMLLCSGFNVYPRVLEEAIYKHPAVEEVAVIGVRDEYRGQSPKAFIKLKQGAATLTLDELQKFLKDKLGKHEMVQALEIRDDTAEEPGRQDLEEGSVRPGGTERRRRPSRRFERPMSADLARRREPHSTQWQISSGPLARQTAFEIQGRQEDGPTEQHGASFLHLETPETPMHVGSLMLFELPEGYKGDYYEDVKALLGKRLHLSALLNRKLAADAVPTGRAGLDRGRRHRARLSCPHRDPASAGHHGPA